MKNTTETTTKNRGGLFTTETFGMALVLYSVLSVVFLLLSDVLFGHQWFYTQFFYGIFGYFSFPFFITLAYFGVNVVLQKKREKGNGAKSFWIILFLVLLVSLLQVVTASNAENGFGKYVEECYNRGEGGISSCSAGGAAFAVISYPFLRIFTPIGCYVVYPLLMLLDLYFLFRASVSTAVKKATTKKFKDTQVAGVKVYPDENFDFGNTPAMQPVKNTLYHGQGKSEFSTPSVRQMKSEKDRSLSILYPDRNSSGKSSFGRISVPPIRNGGPVLNTETMKDFSSRRTGDFANKSYKNQFDSDFEIKKAYITTPPSIETEADREVFNRRATVSFVRTDGNSSNFGFDRNSSIPGGTDSSDRRAKNNPFNFQRNEVNSSFNADRANDFTFNDRRGDNSVDFSRGLLESADERRSTFGTVSESRSNEVNPFSSDNRAYGTDYRMSDGRRNETTTNAIEPNSGTDLFSQRVGGGEVDRNEEYVNAAESVSVDLEDKTPDTPDFSVYDRKEHEKNESDIIMRETIDLIKPDTSIGPFSGKWDTSQPKKKTEVQNLPSAAFPSDFPEEKQTTEQTDGFISAEKKEVKNSKVTSFMSEQKKTVFAVPDEGKVTVGQPEKTPQDHQESDAAVEKVTLNEKLEYIGIPEMPINYKYNNPPIELYKDNLSNAELADNTVEERCGIIESTLESFGVSAKVENVVRGPTLTRYEISIPEGVPVSKIPPRASDLAMWLAVESVRIEAPIPGKSFIGIEIPNAVKETVGMKELMLVDEYKKKGDGLSVVLGKDVVGNPVITDLTKTPHLLVAGATGMGKSVFLNAMIMSLVTKYSPADLRLVLVDPKQVEFSIYENLPHLLVNQIIIEASLCIAILDWAIDEMEERYKIFRSCYAQKIDEYNAQINPKKQKRMPKIVIVIDELGDLFSISNQVKHDIEDRIKRLTQKARAAGIHLVVATQRPDVTVITGVIKANLPSRVAFKVLNYADSNTILSDGGAEKLLGNGDMIFKTSNSALLRRIQGAFVSKEELVNVLNYVKDNNLSYYDSNALSYLNEKKASTQNGGYSASASFGDKGCDSNEEAGTYNGVPLRNIRALREVIIKKSASISLLQRSFSMGYSTAGRLIDWMEKQGYIAGFEGSKARAVLITMEEFEALYGGAELD